MQLRKPDYHDVPFLHSGLNSQSLELMLRYVRVPQLAVAILFH